MRALSSEGVISVGATVVLASEGSGPPEVIKTLKASSVPYVEVTDKSSAEAIVSKVRLVAKVVGAEAEGEKLVQKVMDDFKVLADWRAKVGRPLRALFVLAVQNGRVMVGGQNTSADAMLKLAGAKNVADDVTGFRPLPDEAIVALAPDVIVAMRRSSDKDGHDLSQLSGLKGVQSTPAGHFQAHHHGGRPVYAGLRPSGAGCCTRPDGQVLPGCDRQGRERPNNDDGPPGAGPHAAGTSGR